VSAGGVSSRAVARERRPSSYCGRHAGRPLPAVIALGAALIGLAGGCTRESVRIALETQRRADDVQQAVFARQHEGLCVLLYHDLVRRLSDRGLEMSEAQRAALNDAWNDRDLIEFWTVQQERARALRLVGVDAKLASDQSVVDLLIKAVETRFDRVQQHLASQAAAALAPHAPESQPTDAAGEDR
jgi:hypothetical protein